LIFLNDFFIEKYLKIKKYLIASRFIWRSQNTIYERL